MSKRTSNDSPDYREVSPSQDYFDWELHGDDFLDIIFEKWELDWQGKPAVLCSVVDNDTFEVTGPFYFGNQAILERLLTAGPGYRYRIQPGEKKETDQAISNLPSLK